MPTDDGLGVEINEELDQHFLTNPLKLGRIIEAAGIRPTDHVVEVGSGIGTVAECVPPCRSLTTVEYDANLTAVLAKRVPHATVIQADALVVLPTLAVDVLLSNLPACLTEPLVALVTRLPFRTALLTVPNVDELAGLIGRFTVELVTVLDPDDFRPRQRAHAEVARVVPVGYPASAAPNRSS